MASQDGFGMFEVISQRKVFCGYCIIMFRVKMKTKISLLSFCSTMFFSMVIPVLAHAQSVSANMQTPTPLANVGQCDSTAYSVSEQVNDFASGTAVYVRLNAASEVATQVHVYIQNLTDMSCQLIGSATAVVNNWAKVTTTFRSQTLQGAIVISFPQQENVEVYQATFQLLFLENNTICNSVTTACAASFDGYNGILTVPTSSKATDDIQLFKLAAISNATFSNVDYYDGPSFLYSSKKLGPVNHDYLTGGNNQITTMVTFTNGQILTISQNVDGGFDFSGGLAIRSYIYRSKNRTVAVGILVGIVLLSLLLLWFIHFLVRRHFYKIDHGLDKAGQIEKPHYNEVDESLHITSGKF